MTLKIQCPECHHEMSLKTFKPGRFKPTCTQCKSTFALVIGTGDNPTVKTGKLSTDPKPAAAEQTVEHVSAGSRNSVAALPTAVSEQTIAATPTMPVPVKASDATVAHEQSVTAASSKPPASTPTRLDRANPRSTTLPERLGGYRILKELGRGGMGAVYLAKQLSLDRNVAVKTVQNDWSDNPRVVARFIREAYAAAQLTHHNVVQIYDLGQDNGINYFSMELVEGGSLDDLLKRDGRLNPKQAATYILHAARGLRFAHEHGMIHRDIKPANLMLTSDALVKVADLGLVKTPSQLDDEHASTSEDANVLLASARSQVTGAGSTLGTPAYMSPEQAEDATSVDHRADIYSLGCTFYALLVGKPPFANRSAVEILSKIKTEPIERVDSLVKDVPPQLAALVQKMTAKMPADRCQSLDEVIQSLEQFLNSGGAQPRDRADKLKQVADALPGVPAARLRSLAALGVTGTFALGCLLGLFVGWRFTFFCASCLVCVPVFTWLFNALVGERSPVTQRLRAVALSSTLADWVTWSLGALVLLAVIFLMGLTFWAVAAVIVSLAIAAGYSFGIVRSHHNQHQPLVDQAKEVVRDMRLQGMDESQIASFVGEFAGKNWEGLVEAIFGYEALRSQRAQPSHHKSARWLPQWRDLLVDRLDARLSARREQRERRMLAKVEMASLQSAGVTKKDAEAQAAAMATSLVTAAVETRQLAAPAQAGGQTGAANRERMKQLMATARTGKPQTKIARASRSTGKMLDRLFGGQVRFAVGALLLIGCALWANQNNLFDKEKLDKVSSALQSSAANLSKTTADLDAGKAAAAQVGQQVSQVIGQTQPLKFPVVGAYFRSFATGVIGLLIVLSACVGTWRLTLFAGVAAGITLLGPQLGVPSFGFEQGSDWLSCALGTGVLLLPLIAGSLMPSSTK